MDPERGRKAIGGKIEVKLRVREPLTDKDVEIMTEKWLVIDAFVVPSNRVRISIAYVWKHELLKKKMTNNWTKINEGK